MWLSKRPGQQPRLISGPAQITLGGASPAVMGETERRHAEIYAPGGFAWIPAAEDKVLVIQGETPCIAGLKQPPQENLEPGEVRLYSRGASVCLKNDGRILLEGSLWLNGLPFGSVTSE